MHTISVHIVEKGVIHPLLQSHSFLKHKLTLHWHLGMNRVQNMPMLHGHLFQNCQSCSRRWPLRRMSIYTQLSHSTKMVILRGKLFLYGKLVAFPPV